MNLPRNILISGGSGLIGSALILPLHASGCRIAQLTRRDAPGQIKWEPLQPIAPSLVSGFDAVIHLSGEPIFGRWTAEKKKRIRESRVLSTAHLAKALAEAARPPKVFVCASAVGYYGNRGDEILTEQSPPGVGFLPDVCREWEAAADAATQAGIRTVHLRNGLVLSSAGGALKPMLFPFRLGLGGRVGTGSQWWSWIALADLVGIVRHVLVTDSVSGPVNAVSPNPVQNSEFTRILASVLSRPAILPVPSLAVKLALGEMGAELLLSSQRVRPTALSRSGYSFQNEGLTDTLRTILRK